MSTRARTHQRVGDFQRLFAGVGLGDQQFVPDVHAQLAGIDRVQRVFGIDKAAVPPFFWISATTCRARVVLPEDSGP
jgi:hypothetical protein